MALPEKLQWLKSSWVMLGIFVALAITTVIIIIAGETSRPDAELLQACWHDVGGRERAGYHGDDLELPGGLREAGLCSDPERITWPQGDRLTVAVTSGGESVKPGSVVSAIKLVNKQLKTHLKWTDAVESADIVMAWRLPYDSSRDADTLGTADGYCVHYREGDRLYAEAAVRAQGSNRMEYRVAVHELGHCIGLPHYDVGIMEPEVYDDIDDGRMAFTRFGDRQRWLIRDTYPNN